MSKTALIFMSGNEVSAQSLGDFRVKLKTSSEDHKTSYKLAKAQEASTATQVFKPSSY